MKILIIIAVLLAIYFFFFKKKAVSQKKEEANEEIMVECKKCKTFVSPSEAIVSNGAYFCSKECLK